MALAKAFMGCVFKSSDSLLSMPAKDTFPWHNIMPPSKYKPSGLEASGAYLFRP